MNIIDQTIFLCCLEINLVNVQTQPSSGSMKWKKLKKTLKHLYCRTLHLSGPNFVNFVDENCTCNQMDIYTNMDLDWADMM